VGRAGEEGLEGRAGAACLGSHGFRACCGHVECREGLSGRHLLPGTPQLQTPHSIRRGVWADLKGYRLGVS
jgi:hypothetical protein